MMSPKQKVKAAKDAVLKLYPDAKMKRYKPYKNEFFQVLVNNQPIAMTALTAAEAWQSAAKALDKKEENHV